MIDSAGLHLTAFSQASIDSVSASEHHPSKVSVGFTHSRPKRRGQLSSLELGNTQEVADQTQ